MNLTTMFHASLEALFGRNSTPRRTRQLLLRRHQRAKDNPLTKLFLNKPKRDKEVIRGSTFAFAAMQGWRATMEDEHKHLLPLDNQSWKRWSFFAIFDGHHGRAMDNENGSGTPPSLSSGTDTAKHASDQLDTHLLHALDRMLDRQRGQRIASDESTRSSDLDFYQFHTAIREVYFQLDTSLKAVVQDDSGCVCVRTRRCLPRPANLSLTS